MASWDAFLTEQDKQHVAIWGKRGRDGFGTRPVLLMIDFFYAALGHERKPILESIEDWPMSCGLAGWEAVDRTVPVLAAARANGVPVIYARRLPAFPSDWFRRNDVADGRNRSLARLRPEVAALANEIVAELAPQPGEVIIEKSAASMFAGTPLLFHLRSLGADTLILCGETTSGCVRAAAVDGVTYRYRQGIIGECCFDRTQASHHINLFDMHQKYGDVVSAQEAIDYFAAVKDWRQREQGDTRR